MTRHTPEFIRARDSNLSLRSMAMEQAMLAARQGSIADANNNNINKADAKDLNPEAFTKPYCEFMTENPTVFHATAYFKEKLLKSGYTEVSNSVFPLDSLINS
jgi:aminopeptidase I